MAPNVYAATATTGDRFAIVAGSDHGAQRRAYRRAVRRHLSVARVDRLTAPQARAYFETGQVPA